MEKIEVTVKKLIIIGAGGFGREVVWLVERINEEHQSWDILGFVDDTEVLHGTLVNGYKVLGGCNVIGSYADACFVCAIGSAKDRKKIIGKICAVFPEIQFATLVDPSVIISKRVKVGKGSIICAGTIITVNIGVGNHVIVNLDCTIGHDVVLHDYVTLYPSVNVSGCVDIAECVELGTGVQIIQGKKIGTETIVGAGAVVVKDLPPKCTAVGSPAKPIKFHE